MSTFDRAIRLTVLGWILVLPYGLVVAFDAEEPWSALFFGVIAVALGSWVWFRRSRSALVVSTVVGVLLVLQQIGYSLGSAKDGVTAVLAEDLYGLAVGVLVVVGSGLALRRRGASAVAPSRPDVIHPTAA